MGSTDFESVGFEPCKKKEEEEKKNLSGKKKKINQSSVYFSPAFVKHTELLFSLRP